MNKILTIALSLLLLLGNMGFTMATHYCSGQAVDSKITMGRSHIACGMEESTAPCEGLIIKQKSCCEDEYLLMTIADDYSSNSAIVDIGPVFLFTLIYTFFDFRPSMVTAHQVLVDISPPLPRQCRQVLFQTFLI